MWLLDGQVYNIFLLGERPYMEYTWPNTLTPYIGLVLRRPPQSRDEVIEVEVGACKGNVHAKHEIRHITSFNPPGEI